MYLVRPQKVPLIRMKFVFRHRSTSDARWYAIWPYPTSRSRSHVAFKVRNSSIFKICLLISSAIFSGSWQVTADSLIRGQYLNLVRSDFLISLLVFVSHDFENFKNFARRRSRPSVPHRANFILLCFISFLCCLLCFSSCCSSFVLTHDEVAAWCQLVPSLLCFSLLQILLFSKQHM